MDDMISRQAAIDRATKEHDFFRGAVTVSDKARRDELLNVMCWLGELPSVQPEIIRCKDCKHFVRDDIEEYTPYGFYNTYFHAFCDKHWDNEQGEFIDVKIDDFCSRGERRTNE